MLLHSSTSKSLESDFKCTQQQSDDSDDEMTGDDMAEGARDNSAPDKELVEHEKEMEVDRSSQQEMSEHTNEELSEEDSDAENGKISIKIIHNGKWYPVIDCKEVQSSWTLDYLVNTVIPQITRFESFEVTGDELYGYDGWEYQGTLFFYHTNVYHREGIFTSGNDFKALPEDNKVPVCFVPGTHSEALPEDTPISELNIKDGGIIFFYFCLIKDGKEWFEHYPVEVCPLTVAQKFEIVDQLVDKWMKQSKIFRNEFNQDAIDAQIKK
jgi:hypothetical protein